MAGRRYRRIFRIPVYLLIFGMLLAASGAIRNRRDSVPLEPVVSLPALARTFVPGEFAITDPYAVEGEWRKAQLHTHSSRSLDGKWTPDEALSAYAERGYTFVALSDHDTVAAVQSAPEGLVLVPAEEDNINFPFWPLGQHAVYLFIQARINEGSARERFKQAAAQGALVSIAHPSWTGNLGSGRWEVRHLLAAPDFHLMEVYSSHSDSSLDTRIWHEVVVRRGADAPVWAIAVDDAHDENGHFDSGWTMVKVEALTLDGLKEALRRGSLYATTGPLVSFGVTQDGLIAVAAAGTATEGSYEVSFIDARGEVVARHTGPLPAAYAPTGREGFVRIEVVFLDSGGKAWSQPFWLIAAGSEQEL